MQNNVTGIMRPFNRIDNPKNIDKTLIDSDLKLGKEVIIQFVDQTYSDAVLADLNELCLKYDERLCIRFTGTMESRLTAELY